MTGQPDGVERLRRWSDEVRGVPPAFGRMRCTFDRVAAGSTTVRLPLVPELLLPGGGATAAVTAMLTDFGLASSVISSLPDLRGVTTISLTVDHLALPPTSGALVATCTASPYCGGRPQHATGQVHDDTGRLVAQVSGWLMPTPAEPAGIERVGVPDEPAAAHVADLLQVELSPAFDLQPRDALGNAIGSLHGGSVALAGSLAAEAALPGLVPMSTSLVFLRPTPREGSVHVGAKVVRQGRRTGVADVTVTGQADKLLVTARLVAGAG